MIVKALRMADLGPFSDGVALEGLSGGLDVLVGANELGKSSIFRALVTLIEERHTASSARITRLRHAGGGAPLIEADIDIAGSRIRVRKRYLAQRQATLQDLDSGQTLRGADAEARLEELLSPPGLGGSHRRLLWVAQADSFALPADCGLATPLSALIEREAAETTGAGLARRIAAVIAAELALLQTTHKPPRPRGTLLAAGSAQDAALRALDGARQEADRSATRRKQLAAMRREEEILCHPDTVTSLRRAVTDAQRALDDGIRAREQLRNAVDKLAAGRQLDQAAAKTLAEYESREDERRTLAVRLETGTSERAGIDARQRTASDALATLEARYAALLAELEAARTRRRARAAADARQALAELTAHAGAATDTVRQIAVLQAEAAADRVRESTVADARSLQTEIGQREAEARAGAARVEVAYEPGTTGRLTVDGRQVADRETLLAHAPLEIAIPGIGVLRILPGGSGDATAHAALLRQQQTAILSAMGLPDLAAADAALAAAARRAETLAAARARLGALAPSGVAAIEKELARLRALALDEADASPDDLPPLSEIEQQLSRLEADRVALDRDLASARAAAQGASAALIKCDAELSAQRQRLSTLEAELRGDTASRHAELATAAASARAAHDDARRAHEDWAARTPDEIAVARIQGELERAKAADAQREARLIEARQAIAKLEGELSRDEHDGIGAELMRLEEQAAEAASQLAAIEREAAALSLLVGKLQAAEAQHRGTTLRPLADRLAPLLAQILPEASSELGGLTLVDTIIRRGRAEPFAQLSDGTREQIAVLVRLAWARLLADRGQPAPVVLDDALVYSDDDRLAGMFAVLAQAAQRHQVLVLSCHAKATLAAAETAGAKLLSLTPWHGEEMRALSARA